MDTLELRPATPPWRQWTLRAAWLLLAVAAALYCAWRFAGPTPLQTNLLALLPATEADPVAEEAVDQLALALGNRAVLLVSSNDAAHAKAAAAQLGAALSASHAFASVTARVPPFDPGRITRFYLPHRFGLLTAEDRAGVGIAAGSAGTLRAALTERLYGLPGAGLTTSLADDPFGWLQHWLAGLPLAASNLTIEDGFLVSHEGSTTHVLVLGALPGSAYESDVQRNVLLAVASGETALKAAWPDVIVARTGAVFYAEAARRASERDVHVIGIVTAVGVALLMLWIFRSPRLILLALCLPAAWLAGVAGRAEAWDATWKVGVAKVVITPVELEQPRRIERGHPPGHRRRRVERHVLEAERHLGPRAQLVHLDARRKPVLELIRLRDRPPDHLHRMRQAPLEAKRGTVLDRFVDAVHQCSFGIEVEVRSRCRSSASSLDSHVRR